MIDTCKQSWKGEQIWDGNTFNTTSKYKMVGGFLLDFLEYFKYK